MTDKILIVDDDAQLREELKELLSEYEVFEASDGRLALEMLRRANEIGVVILDVMMPGLSGLDILAEIKKLEPGLTTIILTGHGSKDVAIEALRSRADNFLEKPVDPQALKEIVDKALEATKSGTDEPLGTQEKVEKVLRFIERNCFKKTTLTEAARAVYLSPKYLSRIFKERTGMGFSKYRLKIKTERAKELLRKGGYNVGQISDKLGYENIESFIRQFKKITGYTPTEYRRRHSGPRSKRKAKR